MSEDVEKEGREGGGERRHGLGKGGGKAGSEGGGERREGPNQSNAPSPSHCRHHMVSACHTFPHTSVTCAGMLSRENKACKSEVKDDRTMLTEVHDVLLRYYR